MSENNDVRFLHERVATNGTRIRANKTRERKQIPVIHDVVRLGQGWHVVYSLCDCESCADYDQILSLTVCDEVLPPLTQLVSTFAQANVVYCWVLMPAEEAIANGMRVEAELWL